LFWENSLNSKDAVDNYEFNVGDLVGKYSVVLRGLTKNSDILFDTTSFQIKYKNRQLCVGF
jgi:hypothetical protein